jgi:hypothetical protein
MDLRAGHQPAVIWGRSGNKALPGAGIDDGGDIAGLAGRKPLPQGSRPAGGDRKVNFPALLDFNKGLRGSGDAGSGAGGNPLAAVEAPAPEMDAVGARVTPAANERPQFGGAWRR